MPLQDWTRVTPNDFHDFHLSWIAALRTALNSGLLPEGYFALAEHQAAPFTPDVLTLQLPDATPATWQAGVPTAMLEFTSTAKRRRLKSPALRRVAVRHAEGRRLVAVIEVVSPSNRSGSQARREFLRKSAVFLGEGVHAAIVDPFPTEPTNFPRRLWKRLTGRTLDYRPCKPYLQSSFTAEADDRFSVAVQSCDLGEPLPDLPLSLTADVAVMLPLEATYAAALVGYPQVLRQVLDGRS